MRITVYFNAEGFSVKTQKTSPSETDGDEDMRSKPHFKLPLFLRGRDERARASRS